MNKYHKDIGFRPCDIGAVKWLLCDLEYKKMRFSFHALQELAKEKDAVKIGQVLKDYRLNFNDVFEIAEHNGKIEKLGFRVNFGEKDIIFILSSEKTIVTLWINDKFDNHKTLNKSFYCKV